MFFRSSKRHEDKADDWLIDKFVSTGDLDYLGILYERYMHLVYGVCLKYLKDRDQSKDATMQIFEKLIAELPKRKVENFKAWLHVITKNHCLMHLRSRKSRATREEKLMDSKEIFMESTYEMHHNDERILEKDLESLKKCIEQLKQEQRECVKLFYLDELCYQEIAEEMSYEIKKVKSYIQNGKRNLKICMEEHG